MHIAPSIIHLPMTSFFGYRLLCLVFSSTSYVCIWFVFMPFSCKQPFGEMTPLAIWTPLLTYETREQGGSERESKRNVKCSRRHSRSERMPMLCSATLTAKLTHKTNELSKLKICTDNSSLTVDNVALICRPHSSEKENLKLKGVKRKL